MCIALKEAGVDCAAFFERDEGDFTRLSRSTPAHLGSINPLSQLLRERPVDVIHTTLSSASVSLPKKLHRIGWRGRLIVTGQGVVIPGWHSKNCFALTNVNTKQATELESLTDLEVEVIYNGIDTSVFQPTEYIGGAPIVAWVGRASDFEQKRFDLFADIVPALHQAGVRIWVADPEGPNAVPPSLRDRISPYVDFWDGLSRDRMPGFYRDVAASGGCVLSTARYEGLSFALIEAQACGCPVVAARVVGVDEGVREEYGGTLYSPDLDAAGIGQLLLNTMSDRARMIERGRKCREFVLKEFQQSEIARQYLDIYRRTTQRLAIATSDIHNRRHRAQDLIAATRCASWSFREDLGAIRAAVAIDPTQKWNATVWRLYVTSLLKELAFPIIKRLRSKK
ncbi:glycosyltransferase family 4 protein [Gemmata sp. G18]|uniref:Glycosyltransferase family 4 protein n=1 Tax=Gemmata palustris TaxID=2822762 RepID=A0ABS5C396_9BACT|nr:glycosyltransferase family 4 protein [Gemmata palustris]MBP3960473.1 glycosyltransferase family 4 protein [Gemmata palustris]